MDLFEYMRETEKKKESPLASRMRPTTLDEVVGQQHIIGKDKLLYRAIRADKLGSIILYGPPGTGKTTLAKVIAHTTSAAFQQINATIAGKKDMEAVIKEAQDLLGMYRKKTILFIDEIHRFHKGQQDYLLPYVEDGTITLIGATTENPYFEVNGALLSRSSVFELHVLEKEEIRTLLLRAVQDKEKGMGTFHAQIEEDALDFLAELSGGDARNALNALELGILTTQRSSDGIIHITLDVASECIQKRVMRYDKTGDNHYDTISAFIKSMRGSDPDAAVYYLAKMLAAGEDIKFIARRVMICASEDVGNADPQALSVAVSAAQAVERIGMPEAEIILSQAVLYVACAPKSNSAVMAIAAAKECVRRIQTGVPVHLQDAHYKGAKDLGRGTGYRYAHDYPEHYVRQQYLPDEIQNETFYTPGDLGYEKQIKDRLQRLKEMESAYSE
ncbi:MAG: replication-associated recombination protein A [Ruminococcus sp.]|nr:replication-associated recombination protein A [Ruminococcus sp.]